MGRVLRYVWHGPAGLPDGFSVEWQLVPLRWLAIVVVLLALPWVPLGVQERANGVLIVGYGALFNLALQCALHARPRLLASGYLSAVGDTTLTLAMVTLAGGFDSPFFSMFFVVGVSIAMRSSFGPAAAMALLVIAAEVFGPGLTTGALAIRALILCLTVFLASYMRAQALSERKVAEEALRASEERSRRQYKGGPLPTYSWLQVGDDFVLQDFNDAAEAVPGASIQRVGALASVRFAAYPEIQADLRTCVANHGASRRELLFRYPESGRQRDLAITYVYMPPRTVMLHTDDMTERKQADQQREAMAQSEKLRALGQMATGIAHDLNQSLMLVASYSDLARQALLQNPPNFVELEDLLTTTTQAALDGGETVKRLLLFTRAAPEHDNKRVDLTSLVREAAQLTAPRWRDAAQAEGRPISLHIETAGHPTVRGSPGRLRELLTNLIFNAVDALPSGGTLRLRVLAEGGQGIVEVVDSGLGMSAEVQARVFEPFFTTKGEGGTGLGLAMVFGIVEQHGGHIQVQSAPGAGTTFRMTFPLLDPLCAPEQVAASVIQAPLVRLRILAVDDEPMMTKAVVRMLKPSGHLVSVAASGEEALARMAEQPFDVVVSDMGMGAGMNGWELAEAVRTRWPSVRFLLATGWGAAMDPVEARSRGIEAVLSKPYHPVELLHALAQTTIAA